MPITRYIFLDEGGDFGFNLTGSKFFSLTAVVKVRPFVIHDTLASLKYDLYDQGKGQEYFHATEDKQDIRNLVFGKICAALDKMHIHSILVEKRKTMPSLQPQEKFYPRMLGYLLKHVVRRALPDDWDELIVITDTIPDKGKRKLIEKTVKVTLAEILPPGKRYQIHHHASKSCFGLQIADYCNWAIFRKWDKGDARSYELIKPAVKSEFDIFQLGATYWY